MMNTALFAPKTDPAPDPPVGKRDCLAIVPPGCDWFAVFIYGARDAAQNGRRANGRRERIRTSGPHVPNVVLYQAELLSDAPEGRSL
jgi:hypothetical protein